MFLEKFFFPSPGQEECYGGKMTCYNDYYPFGVFTYRNLPCFEFEPITIFYGGNGSGKSTILNVIAEKLCIRRGVPFNKSPFFDDYVELCSSDGRRIPKESRIVTSDDVFDFLLDLRCTRTSDSPRSWNPRPSRSSRSSSSSPYSSGRSASCSRG